MCCRDRAASHRPTKTSSSLRSLYSTCCRCANITDMRHATPHLIGIRGTHVQRSDRTEQQTNNNITNYTVFGASAPHRTSDSAAKLALQLGHIAEALDHIGRCAVLLLVVKVEALAARIDRRLVIGRTGVRQCTVGRMREQRSAFARTLQ